MNGFERGEVEGKEGDVRIWDLFLNVGNGIFALSLVSCSQNDVARIVLCESKYGFLAQSDVSCIDCLSARSFIVFRFAKAHTSSDEEDLPRKIWYIGIWSERSSEKAEHFELANLGYQRKVNWCL